MVTHGAAAFHEGHRNLIFGLNFNDNFDESGKFNAKAGLEKYIEILKESNKCEDISGYVGVKKADFLFQCEGEIFTTRDTIYGQVTLSLGAIELLKNTLAPASSWVCEYIPSN